MDNDGGDSENPPITDVIKWLKENDSYDESLTEKEMVELYTVLKKSQNTASEEDQQRRILDQTDANCQLLEELRMNGVSVYPTVEVESVEVPEKDANASYGDVSSSSSSNNDFVAEERTRGSSTRKPFAPKTWSNTKARPSFDIEEQISSTVIATNVTRQYETGEGEGDGEVVDVFNSVPTAHEPLKRITIVPKFVAPFYCSPKLDNIDYKQRARLIAEYHVVLLQKSSDYHRQSLYPAPWGKPIQGNQRFNGSLIRKVDKTDEENESLENDDKHNDSSKEDKDFQEEFELYTSKSGRQTKRKLYSEDAGEWKKKSKPSPVVSNVNTRKRQNLSNEEIMKRSKLFSNDKAAPTRADKLFAKFIDDEPKRQEEERRMEKFNSTLQSNCSDEDVESTSDIAELVHSEEPFTRRRIAPPSRRAGRGRNSRQRSSDRKTSDENSSQSQELEKYAPLQITQATAGNRDSLTTGTCPICSEQFLQSELLEHAATCGDSSVESSIPVTRSSSSREKISCENCDEVLPLDTNYEVHIKECLVRSRIVKK